MRKTGIRNLKNHLSEYLESVRNGETIIVTHHNREIAKVIPVEPANEKEHVLQVLHQLAEQNLIVLPEKWGGHNHDLREVDLLKVPGKPVSEMIIADRR